MEADKKDIELKATDEDMELKDKLLHVLPTEEQKECGTDVLYRGKPACAACVGIPGKFVHAKPQEQKECCKLCRCANKGEDNMCHMEECECHSSQEQTGGWEMKYRSIWQVLNARNDLGSKYRVIQNLIDGILTSQRQAILEEVERELGEEKTHTNHEKDELYCCLDCHDDGIHNTLHAHMKGVISRLREGRN